MARMNAFSNASAVGRLVDHPVFRDLKDGAKSAWVRVAIDRSEIDPQTKQRRVDVIPFDMYISAERVNKMPMFWAFKGSQVALTYAPRSFMRETPEGNRSSFSLAIDDFEVLDTQAETNSRLLRYAEAGDKVAQAALASRQGGQMQAQAPVQGSYQAPYQGQVPAQAPQAPVPGMSHADLLADVPWLNQQNTQAPDWA